jgi:hypothetical protein
MQLMPLYIVGVPVLQAIIKEFFCRFNIASTTSLLELYAQFMNEIN